MIISNILIYFQSTITNRRQYSIQHKDQIVFNLDVCIKNFINNKLPKNMLPYAFIALLTHIFHILFTKHSLNTRIALNTPVLRNLAPVLRNLAPVLRNLGPVYYIITASVTI